MHPLLLRCLGAHFDAADVVGASLLLSSILQSEVAVADVDVPNQVVNEDVVVETLFRTELAKMHPVMLMMLRTSDGLPASHQHHVVVVTLRCAVVTLWYCTHVVLLVV